MLVFISLLSLLLVVVVLYVRVFVHYETTVLFIIVFGNGFFRCVPFDLCALRLFTYTNV